MQLSIPKIATGLLLLLTLNACDRDFEAINQDPNNLTGEVTPNLLLPAAIQTAVNAYVAPTLGLEVGNLLVQHWARVTSLEVDRYVYESTFDPLWSNFYLNALPDLDLMYALGEQSGNPNYQAVALIFKAWLYSLLTDLHGDIPYSEALRGLSKQVYAPRYDLQQDVYAGLIGDLEKANELIVVGAYPISGDILLNGNMLWWKKFANSLSLRLLLRQAGKTDAKVEVAARIKRILDDPSRYPVLTSNQDNVALNYLNTPANSYPYSRLDPNRQNQFRMSKTLVDKLIAIRDPRLPVFADLPEDPTIKTYVGVVNGAGGQPSATSKPGARFRQATTPAVLMTWSEVLFIQAEAAARGLLPGDGAKFYQEAITASIAQHGVTAPADYFTQPGVAYQPENALSQIGEQKWIALYGQGLEAWFEWRRTGFPKLEPARNNVNGDRIPVRMIYPLNEQSANPQHYQEAVGRQGENTVNTPVWWDR